MTIFTISERIASLNDTQKDCASRITRLSKLTSEHERTQLATSIHQTLRDAETSYELLEDDVNATQDGETLAALKAKTAKIGEDLKIARLQYRKAQLAAKRNAESTEKAEREQLLGGAAARAEARRGKGGVGNEKVSEQDLLLTASSDVTTALRRTQNLMAEELSRSRFASETLALSTEALKDLSHRYSVFDDVLGRSKELIRDLVKKNKSDRWYYEKAIQILIGTLIWIVLRRLFWGPVYLMLFMPVKSVLWVGGTIFGVTKHLATDGKMDPQVQKAVEAVYSAITTTEIAPNYPETTTTTAREEMQTEEVLWKEIKADNILRDESQNDDVRGEDAQADDIEGEPEEVVDPVATEPEVVGDYVRVEL